MLTYTHMSVINYSICWNLPSGNNKIQQKIARKRRKGWRRKVLATSSPKSGAQVQCVPFARQNVLFWKQSVTNSVTFSCFLVLFCEFVLFFLPLFKNSNGFATLVTFARRRLRRPSTLERFNSRPKNRTFPRSTLIVFPTLPVNAITAALSTVISTYTPSKFFGFNRFVNRTGSVFSKQKCPVRSYRTSIYMYSCQLFRGCYTQGILNHWLVI